MNTDQANEKLHEYDLFPGLMQIVEGTHGGGMKISELITGYDHEAGAGKLLDWEGDPNLERSVGRLLLRTLHRHIALRP